MGAVIRRRPASAAALAPLVLAATLLLGVGAASATETPGSDPTQSPSAGETQSPGTATPFVEPLVRSSRAVLSGTVEQISTDELVGPTQVAGSARVSVDRVYKPRGPEIVTTEAVDITLARVPRACADATQVEVGRRYVFFATFDEEVLGSSACGGVLAATPAVLTQIEDLGFTGRDPVPGEPAPAPVAELTQLDGSEPASFTRSAAPGAALVLVGLLGLAVVRRVSRRG